VFILFNYTTVKFFPIFYRLFLGLIDHGKIIREGGVMEALTRKSDPV
jgi:hypothetical protein